MADDTLASSGEYDGYPAAKLAQLLAVPCVVALSEVRSTLDVAHSLGAGGAPSGTLILADSQTAGRGRLGRSWQSEPGRGIWLTLVERPADVEAICVLSLRLGINAARILDQFADDAVQLKWPNDLYVRGAGKLAGILVEARWRSQRLDWIAVGFGLNVHAPQALAAAGLRSGTARVDVLTQLVPALRASANSAGQLSDAEREAFALRDLALGRHCREPVDGIVAGVGPQGALLVDTPAGREYVRAGSLVLKEDR